MYELIQSLLFLLTVASVRLSGPGFRMKRRVLSKDPQPLPLRLDGRNEVIPHPRYLGHRRQFAEESFMTVWIVNTVYFPVIQEARISLNISQRWALSLKPSPPTNSQSVRSWQKSGTRLTFLTKCCASEYIG